MMSENGKFENNMVEDTSDKIQESMWRLKIKSDHDDDNHGGIGAQSSPYPDRPGEPDCIYYLRTGLCGYGTNCRFNHPSYINSEGVHYEGELPQRIGQPDCGYFLKTGTCKFASTCKYNHPLDRDGAEPVSFNTLGLPMRQEEKPCPYYMKTSFCKFGYACKFHHPEPTTIGTSLPGQPHSTFKPITSQGWNIYMGNMSILGSNAQVNSLSTSIMYYPERPDQPDCRYFMNTGTCKYGSDCKYNHPTQRMAKLAPNFTGPYGLPLRPGETVCWYYNLYGICKYGPTCKFDHPSAGYPYTNGLSMSPLPMVDPSLYLPRNTSTVISSRITASMSPKNHVSDKIPHVEISLQGPSEETESAPQSLQTPSEPHD